MRGIGRPNQYMAPKPIKGRMSKKVAALEKAYADGLLSEKEYKEQRKKILDRK